MGYRLVTGLYVANHICLAPELLLTHTDSIVTTKEISEFPISDKIGDFKVKYGPIYIRCVGNKKWRE